MDLAFNIIHNMKIDFSLVFFFFVSVLVEVPMLCSIRFVYSYPILPIVIIIDRTIYFLCLT